MKSPLADRFVADRSRLVDLARRLVRSHEDAEDVVHDVYLRLEATAASARVPDAWLTTAVRNAAIDRTRRRARERRLAEHAAAASEPQRSAEAEALVRAELESALDLLLDRLDAEGAALWLLREVFGVDHATLARALAVSEAGARQATRRTRQRLEDPLRLRVRAVDDDADFAAICRHALSTGDTGALFALVHRSPRATAFGGTPRAGAAPGRAETTAQLVRVGDRYAIALVLGGAILCAVPIGCEDGVTAA